MRKSIPFEIAGSTLDYQVLEGRDGKSETVQVLVAMAGAGLLARHLGLLEKVGLNPTVVDLLPVAVGNALWSWVGAPKSDSPHVAVHIGPQISTIVIDGARSPFFNRYVYLAAEDFPGKEPGAPDVERKLHNLAEEVARSLAFYEKSSFAAGFQQVMLLGEFLDTPALAEKLRRQTGLPVQKIDLPRKLGRTHDQPAGRFDLATALALRAGGE
jgi:Tfp pilus assembly PilM family ATPase